jgi:histidinol-phosphatase (PHP family)
MIKANYHLHSTYSYDGEAGLEAMAGAALAGGFADIAFTEHLDFDRSDPGYGYFDYAAYGAAVEAARERFRGRLAIRRGIEFDFRRDYRDEPRRVLAGMDFDFRIGSVHSAGGVLLFRLSSLTEEETARLDLRRLQAEYFAEVEALLGSRLAHALGHFDYLYKHAPRLFAPWRDAWYWDRVEAILKACIRTGTALEVNSHHVLDRGLALAADAEILARYRRLGGRLLTVGSDAHRPADVAHAYGDLERAVRAAGFAEVTGFEAGVPYAIAL